MRTNKKKKTDKVGSIGKQSGESVESVLKKKGRLWWEVLQKGKHLQK